MVICPEYGATILELVVAGETLIKVDDHFPENYQFQSAILSPFPNKIRNGIYDFEGKDYQLTTNDAAMKNAAHGLIYNKKFTVESLNCDADNAEIRLCYIYDNEDIGYPFKIKLIVTFYLQCSSGLTITFRVTNLSNRVIPYGMGFHPYFQFGCPLSETKLIIPECEKLDFDNDNFPMGDSIRWNDFSGGKTIGSVKFNSCFWVKEPNGHLNIEIQRDNSFQNFKLWFETGVNKFNFFQLYTLHNTNEIAIEPMTCAPDAFNNKLGLMYLKSGTEISTKFGIQVEN
jgi:aldose 1-epimerase